MTEETSGRLRAIRKQKGWSIERALVAALNLLEAELKVEARAAAFVELHKRAIEEEARGSTLQPAKPPAKSRKLKSQPEPGEIDGQKSLL